MISSRGWNRCVEFLAAPHASSVCAAVLLLYAHLAEHVSKHQNMCLRLCSRGCTVPGICVPSHSLRATEPGISRKHWVWERGVTDGEQEVTRADAEDVVDIMKACLLDKLLDDTGILDFRSTGSKSKQVPCPAAHIVTCTHMLTRGSHPLSCTPRLYCLPNLQSCLAWPDY